MDQRDYPRLAATRDSLARLIARDMAEYGACDVSLIVKFREADAAVDALFT